MVAALRHLAASDDVPIRRAWRSVTLDTRPLPPAGFPARAEGQEGVGWPSRLRTARLVARQTPGFCAPRVDRLTQPLMRLPRTSLLGRLAGAHAPRVVLLEAPTGYGKSWLIRKAAAPTECSACAASSGRSRPAIPAGDDRRHRRCPSARRRVGRRCWSTASRTPTTLRLILAGRILPDGVHEVAQLVDGLIIDAAALAVGTPRDRRSRAGPLGARSPTGWSRRPTAASASSPPPLDQAMRDPGADPDRPRLADGAGGQLGGDAAARRRATTRSSACSPARQASTGGCSIGWPGRGSSSGPSPPACRCAGYLTGGLDLAAAASFRVGAGRADGRRPPRRRARRAGPADRGHRPAARRRRPRATPPAW